MAFVFGGITAEARRAFDFYRDARAELLADEIQVPSFEEMVRAAVAGIRRGENEHSKNRPTGREE
jgi:hypothetical protein